MEWGGAMTVVSNADFGAEPLRIGYDYLGTLDFGIYGDGCLLLFGELFGRHFRRVDELMAETIAVSGPGCRSVIVDVSAVTWFSPCAVEALQRLVANGERDGIAIALVAIPGAEAYRALKAAGLKVLHSPSRE
ncbi:Uncharacterised protein [Mycolicibacterium gilvum]|uniref:STAS domain-containing protein n=2 Tax=Mycolicibacterium gilvum TaxID=1804 RepID=A0A378SGK9_9MYCO|nr:Uncharacterised protein [Mycolicibacterium gilvum]